MDLAFSEELEGFRTEVREFLKAAFIEPSRKGAFDLTRFRAAAVSAGYFYRNVPRQYGGSEQPPDLMKARVIAEEFAKVGAPGEIRTNGTQMLVPVLLERGSDWQKEAFIPKTLSGEYRWAQGYSEPGAGSDLASLRTRAVLRDGHWIINGQKVWTSYAKSCTHMFALVRTDMEAPKHKGISYLLLKLDQPGVEIRPMKQITGETEFNEVFFSDAVTPEDWIVGAPGEGWSVSKSLLKHERNWIGGVDRTDKLFDSLLKLARRTEVGGCPAIKLDWVRERLAKLKAQAEVMRYSTLTQVTREAAGRPIGPTGLMNKLAQSAFFEGVARLSLDIIGDSALVSPVDVERPGAERWLMQYMNSLASTIAGGTSNIQRNIIAERGLGLPRDPGGAQ